MADSRTSREKMINDLTLCYLRLSCSQQSHFLQKNKLIYSDRGMPAIQLVLAATSTGLSII